MFRHLFINLVVFLTLLVPLSARALDPNKTISQYVHRIWNAESGLPMNLVLAIEQTNDGYLWVGTGEGLMRFDGVRFTQINPKEAPVVRNSEIFDLFEDGSGALWIGTTGAGAIRYENGKYTIFNDTNGLRNNIIVDFAQSNDGALWIGTRGGGVNVLKNGRWTYFSKDEGLLNNVINNILVDSSGNKWIGTDHGISVLDQNNEIAKSFTVENGLVDNRVAKMFEDKAGNIWIGTEEGLSVYSNGAFETSSDLAASRIMDILEDKHGNIWVATYFDGLFVSYSGSFLDFSKDDKIKEFAETRCFFEDNESNLWIGTGSEGLSFLSDGNVVTYTEAHGLGSNNIWGVMEDSKKTIWIGTANGFYTFKDGVFELFAGEQQGITGYAYSMLETKSGERWFSATGIGVTRYSKGRFEFLGEDRKLDNTRVRAFFEDSKGTLWVGTVKGGLYRLQNGEVTNYTMKDGLPDMRVSYIAEDKDGTLWLATDGGIGLVKDGKITTITAEKDGLPINQIMLFHFDDDDNVWIATYGKGLILLKDGKYYSIESQDGIFNNAIYSILEDDFGNLWLGTNVGIVKVSKEELLLFASGAIESVKATLLGKDDGMKRSECNGGGQHPALKASDGKLWMSTIGGVAVIDPANLVVQEKSPSVLVENVIVDGIEIGDGAMLEPGAERFEFQFTGFNYFAPDKLRFEHFIEGFDKDWVKIDDRRIAYYMHIPWGEYTFRVRACNKNGVCNEEGDSFNFSIEPKFTQTYTFWALAVLAGMLSIVMLVVLRVRQVRERDKKVSMLAWNTTKKALEGQVDAIKKIAEDTSSISDNMGSLSSTLSTTSTGLETAVAQAGSALEELEITGMQSESNAKLVLKSSAKSVKFADVGHAAADRTRLVMKNVEEGSTEIVEKSKNLFNRLAEVDTIVSVVNSIADQSKVLSINASIEASLAGEHGKGFAVVAREFSDLAKQIKESTSTVAEMLTHSHYAIRDIVKAAESTRTETEDGVKSAHNSEKTVSDLSEALQRNTDMAHEIESALGEQKNGLQLISNGIQRVLKTASENATISDSVDEEAKRLAVFVKQLMDMIENWRTPDLYR